MGTALFIDKHTTKISGFFDVQLSHYLYKTTQGEKVGQEQKV